MQKKVNDILIIAVSLIILSTIMGIIFAYKVDYPILELIYFSMLSLSYFVYKQKAWARICLSCIFLFSIPYQIIPVSNQLSKLTKLGFMGIVYLTILAYAVKLLHRKY